MAGHLKRSASSAFEHGSTSDCAIDLDADLDYYTLSPFQQPQPSKIRRSPNAGFSSSSFAPPRGNGYASARGMNTLGYDLVELEDVIGRDPLRPRATFGSGSAGGNNYGYYPNSYDSMLSRNPTKPPAATMTATNHNTFAQDDFGLLDGWDGSNWQGGNDTKNLDFSAGAAMGEDELNKFIMNIQDTAPPPPAAAATFAPNRRKPKPQPMFTPPSEIIDLTDDDVIDLTTDKGNINNTRSGAMSDLQFLGPPRSSFRPPFGSRLPEGIKIIRHPNGGVEFDVSEIRDTHMAPVSRIPEGPKFTDLTSQSTELNPRDLRGLVSKLGVGDEALLSKMPSAKQPPRIKTKLLPYQLQGLAWLLQKEHPQMPTGDTVEQLFKKIPGGYYNVATRMTAKDSDPPKFASGFVLADDMGLGKTIQIISLIVTDVKAEKELVPVPYVRPNRENCDAGTLIIAPVSVMSNWTGQMAQHVDPEHPLKVLTYHGSNASRINADLSSYDVVVTSYGTMLSEANQGTRKGLFSRKWRRVVLDEAHIIRNPKAKCSQAACNLRALSYCSLTGTPIINTLKDLYSQLKFMKYPGGLSDYGGFVATVMRSKQSPLQIIVGTLCLRRTKDMDFVDLKLPEFKSYVRAVQLTTSERDKYALLEQEAKGLLILYRRKKGLDGAEGAEAYRNLLEILLRMRQCVNHTGLCGERLEALRQLAETARIDPSNPAQTRALQDILQLSIDSAEDCAICYEPLHNPRITICKHVFGQECIEASITRHGQCPMCRSPLTDPESTLIEPAPPGPPSPTPTPPSPATIIDENDESGPPPSSKITALLEILNATRASDPTRKTIVFSQWTSFLTLVQPHLTGAGITFARIDGTMKPESRDAAIASLRDNPRCTVLLASLTVCSVGLNLTMASQCVLCDSWWAGAIEQQAIDRVYRLGQERDVDVWRLVVEKSIEQKVLAIQDKKARLVEAAFQEGGRRRRRGMGERRRGLEDIEELLA